MLIAEVRTIYDGPVGYNCDKYGEDHITWWDAVDVIASADIILSMIGRISWIVLRKWFENIKKAFSVRGAGCMNIHGSAAGAK